MEADDSNDPRKRKNSIDDSTYEDEVEKRKQKRKEYDNRYREKHPHKSDLAKQANKDYCKRYRDKRRTLNLLSTDQTTKQSVPPQIAGPSTRDVPYIPRTAIHSSGPFTTDDIHSEIIHIEQITGPPSHSDDNPPIHNVADIIVPSQPPSQIVNASLSETHMEESSAVRPYFLKERRNKSYNIDKLIEEQIPVKQLTSKGARKSLPAKQTKQVVHNQYNPTRYERERATMKNKPRKVLNLEERVLAIRLYQEKPVYQRVASVFKCSWEQIRNVIANRDDILRYYGECQTVTHKDTPQFARNKKINFLGNVTYEFVRRAHYHRSVSLNDDVLRQRALKLRDILQIEQFHPNRAWLADFKKVYNVEWENLDALIICGVPPRSLDNKDLIEYCTRMVAKAKSLIGKLPKPLSKKENSKLYEEEDSDNEWASSGGGGDGGEASFDAKRSDTMSELNDDVPVVNEIDDFTGMYLDTADNDEEEFNGFETTSSQTHITSEPPLVTEVQIKQERRSRSRSRSPPLLSPLTVTSGTSTSVTTAGGGGLKRKYSDTTPKPADIVESNSKRFKSDTVATYTEALRNLSSLEDFVTQEEDFEAINLLIQLAGVFEKGAKRSTARNRIFNS